VTSPQEGAMDDSPTPHGSAKTAPGATASSAYRLPASGTLLGMDFSSMSWAEKVALLHEILERKIHGIAFSPYLEGQRPGAEISEDQIRDRLDTISQHAHWIRSFSCIEGNQEIARIAGEQGLRTMVGIDIGPDPEDNEIELTNGIEVACAGHADIIVVGNENLLRGDVPPEQLIRYIERVRAAVPDLPVSFVDAYFLFEQHRDVVDACDVLLVNCYPYWESVPAEYALLAMKEMYRRAQRVAGDKQVIISETGWPTAGTAFGAAVPSLENALEYFLNAYRWAEEEGIEIFYFSAFDEAWKTGAEGDVGAYWGLWDQHGNLKYV
jgi:exo-beta-1,3-glucanase (GH17 family)